MLNDFKVRLYFTVIAASANFSPTGVSGYGAAAVFVVVIFSTVTRIIHQWLRQQWALRSFFVRPSFGRTWVLRPPLLGRWRTASRPELRHLRREGECCHA
jgi:hypothetical protein